LLEQLQGEFEQIKLIINKNLENLNDRDVSGLQLYSSCGLKKPDFPDDEVVNLLADVFSNYQLNLYQGALEDAINTGKLSLVENDELRIKLYAWKNGVIRIQDFNSTTNQDVMQFLREIYHTISFRNYDNNYYPEIGIGESEFVSDPNEIFNTIYFENQVGVLFFRNKRLIEFYEENLTEPLDRILTLIESELLKSPNLKHTQKN
jgi:hypothetical protein